MVPSLLEEVMTASAISSRYEQCNTFRSVFALRVGQTLALR